MMKKLLMALLMIIVVLIFTVHTAVAESQGITVSAAISLKNVFEELGNLFNSRNKDLKIAFNFGASGDLMAQIRGGAPVDVFASAALKDMEDLDKNGFLLRDSMVNFTSNSIVLVIPAASKVQISSFKDLKKPDVKRIAIGNPKSVPAGRYAYEALQYLKLSEAVKDKLVFVENVRQALDYVSRNEVDAGVLYATDAKTRLAEVAVIAAAPEGSHKPVIYPIAVVKGTRNEKTARAFISFVLSDESRKIFEKYGFKAVK